MPTTRPATWTTRLGVLIVNRTRFLVMSGAWTTWFGPVTVTTVVVPDAVTVAVVPGSVTVSAGRSTV